MDLDDLDATVHDDKLAPEEPAPEGPRIGRYLVLDRLGAGGMGTVFLAHDPELDRKVAIKLLRGGASQLSHARLLREAQAMAQLSHPHVAAVHDVGWFGKQVFMAMEYLPGGTVQEWLKTPRSWQEVLAVFIAAGRGLAAAHALGLIHRDFKPANVLLGTDQAPKVTDFGLVRSDRSGAARPSSLAAGAPAESSPAESSSASESASNAIPTAFSASTSGSIFAVIAAELGASNSQVSDLGSSSGLGSGNAARMLDLQLTMAGSSVGTPAYMSPEQIDAADVDALSDQFSFCVALHEALWGVSPFVGDDIKARLRAVLEDDRRPRPRDREVPDWLAPIIDRGLQQDPAQRWPSMEALLQALADDPAARRKSRRRLGLTSGLGLALVAGLWGRHELVQARCDQLSAGAQDVWAQYAPTIDKAVRTGGPAYADANASRVQAGVEDWIARWTAARASACEEPREASEQAPLERCLGEQLEAFSALLAVIDEQSSASGIAAQAISAVAALPDPAACDDPRYAADFAGDCDPALTLSLHRLRALELAGLHEQGLDAGEVLLADPGLRGCASLEAQALLVTGRLELATGQGTHERALTRLRRALHLANGRGDLPTARGAALALASVERQQSHFDQALIWVELAELFAERLGSRPAEVIEQELARAELLRSAGRGDEARAVLERAHGLLLDTLGEQHPSYLRYLSQAAALEIANSNRARARELLDQALTMAEGLYGPDHPETVAIMIQSVVTQPDNGAMLAMARAAVVKAEAAHGPGHPQVVLAHERFAFATLLGGDTDQAAELYAEVIREYEQLTSPAPASLARALMHYGIACRRRRDLELAEVQLRRAVTILETELGGDHPDLSNGLVNLANIVDDLGRISEAVMLQRRALDILERRSQDPVGIALLLDNMGMLELALGDAPGALRSIERAATLGRAALPAESLQNVDYLTDLAVVEAANGQIERARGHFDQAVTLCASHSDPGNHECVYTRGIFARFLLDDQPGALDLARETIDGAIANIDRVHAPEDRDLLRFIQARVLARSGEREQALTIARLVLESVAQRSNERRARELGQEINGWRAGLLRAEDF